MNRPPNAPRGLKAPGKKLWSEVVTLLELRPDESAILEQACRVRDQIADFDAVLDAEGLMSTGSTGQPVPHPLVAELRQARALFQRLINSIEVPDGDPTSQQAREAAQARWGRRKRVNEARRGAS